MGLIDNFEISGIIESYSPHNCPIYASSSQRLEVKLRINPFLCFFVFPIEFQFA